MTRLQLHVLYIPYVFTVEYGLCRLWPLVHSYTGDRFAEVPSTCSICSLSLPPGSRSQSRKYGSFAPPVDRAVRC